MARTYLGASVLYCGHEGHFIADIWVVGNCNVVRASRAVTANNLDRVARHQATHHITDFPTLGFWRPDIGVFVVPAKQVVKLDDDNRWRYLKSEGGNNG